MKHWKCDDCHHEWDGSRTECDWCSGKGSVLAERTLALPPVGQLLKRLDEAHKARKATRH